jgi:hypothetical protein
MTNLYELKEQGKYQCPRCKETGTDCGPGFCAKTGYVWLVWPDTGEPLPWSPQEILDGIRYPEPK